MACHQADLASSDGLQGSTEDLLMDLGPPAFPSGNGDTLGLAARFFDRNCAGTLDGDDIEEIVFMTAPPISRASPPEALFCSCPPWHCR